MAPSLLDEVFDDVAGVPSSDACRLGLLVLPLCAHAPTHVPVDAIRRGSLGEEKCGNKMQQEVTAVTLITTVNCVD